MFYLFSSNQVTTKIFWPWIKWNYSSYTETYSIEACTQMLLPLLACSDVNTYPFWTAICIHAQIQFWAWRWVSAPCAFNCIGGFNLRLNKDGFSYFKVVRLGLSGFLKEVIHGYSIIHDRNLARLFYWRKWFYDYHIAQNSGG